MELTTVKKFSPENFRRHRALFIPRSRLSQAGASLDHKKAGLNRSILDAGWGEFRRQLDYKVSWNGGIVEVVDHKNTSRRCPVCGHTAKENRVSQSEFICVACGHTDDADVNAAINILRAAHVQLACQANGDSMPSATGTLKAAA